jgi:hypothetical protein
VNDKRAGARARIARVLGMHAHARVHVRAVVIDVHKKMQATSILNPNPG